MLSNVYELSADKPCKYLTAAFFERKFSHQQAPHELSIAVYCPLFSRIKKKLFFLLSKFFTFIVNNSAIFTNKFLRKMCIFLDNFIDHSFCPLKILFSSIKSQLLFYHKKTIFRIVLKRHSFYENLVSVIHHCGYATCVQRD